MSNNLSFFANKVNDAYKKMGNNLSVSYNKSYINKPDFNISDAEYHKNSVKIDGYNMRKDYEKAVNKYKK